MLGTPRFSEGGRRLVHLLGGAGALALPYVPWWQAVVALALATLLLARAVAHPAHALHPALVLLLLLLFPGRPDIVAATWGLLAAGHGAAFVIGRLVPAPGVPWNRASPVAGAVAFALAGGSAAAALSWWCRDAVVPPAFWWFTTFAPMGAAASAALAVTIPVRLHDEIIAAGVAVPVLFCLSVVNGQMAAEQAARALALLPVVLGVNAFAAGAGCVAGVVSRGGAASGALIGTVVAVSAGWRGWLLLFLTLAAAAAATRLGAKRKSLLGIAEERGGRRGAASAFANTIVATAAAVLATISYATTPALVAFVAALAAGGADTVASEVGKAWGRRTYALVPPRTVAAGTPGAMSAAGTAAGLAAAVAFAAAGMLMHLVPPAALVPVVAGACAGSLVESLLGGTLEASGYVNNAMLNVINTGVAAAVAIALLGVLPRP